MGRASIRHRRRSYSTDSWWLSSPRACLNNRGRGALTYLRLPRGCRLVLQALASRINVQHAGCPPPSFDVQRAQLGNTRASSMIAAAETHNKVKVGCLLRTLGGFKLGAIIEESHTTLITFAGGVVARCLRSPRTRPRDPAIWVRRPLCRSLTLLQTYIAHPHDFPSIFIFIFIFIIPPPQRMQRMRWPVLAIVLDVICDSCG
jgi:hypothetical protein